jgi:hypothetical protein
MPNNTTSNRGKTAVHEVGHWLGLRHIWGDGQGSAALCDSTDYVDDTPNADTASQQTCIIKNSCSNESPYWTLAGIDPPDMIENYMDYSYDNCMTMFSAGQKDRMLGFLNTVRTSLLSSPGCTPTGLSEWSPARFKIFPNPAYDAVQIMPRGDEAYSYTLSDMTGRILISGNNKGPATIDLQKVSAGAMTLTIREASGTIFHQKVIKSAGEH